MYRHTVTDLIEKICETESDLAHQRRHIDVLKNPDVIARAQQDIVYLENKLSALTADLNVIRQIGGNNIPVYEIEEYIMSVDN